MDKDAFLTEHKENVRRNRMAQSGFWKWSTLLLLLIIIVGIYMYGLPGRVTEQSQDKASEKALAFLNQNLLAGFATANLESATEENNVYKLEVNIISTVSDEEQNATLYITKNGDLLFPSAIDISDFQFEETQTFAVEAADDPVLGNANASLTIVEYSDFECPYCGQTYWTMKLVLADYADDVNIVYKNYLLPKHAYAQKAAEAAECANLQGDFTAYHDMLFENQDALNVKDLKQYAVNLGLDTAAFNECLDSGIMAEEVAADQAEGVALGVKGTPTFFIGEQTVIGSQEFAVFKLAIDEELAKTSS
ncbi:MAG: thioredoxin domain-containing protein [bacterium]|nr:thioredoxin domain-containing protein [bacterium]